MAQRMPAPNMDGNFFEERGNPTNSIPNNKTIKIKPQTTNFESKNRKEDPISASTPPWFDNDGPELFEKEEMVDGGVFCSRCGKQNDRTSSFCNRCGLQMNNIASAHFPKQSQSDSQPRVAPQQNQNDVNSQQYNLNSKFDDQIVSNQQLLDQKQKENIQTEPLQQDNNNDFFTNLTTPMQTVVPPSSSTLPQIPQTSSNNNLHVLEPPAPCPKLNTGDVCAAETFPLNTDDYPQFSSFPTGPNSSLDQPPSINEVPDGTTGSKNESIPLSNSSLNQRSMTESGLMNSNNNQSASLSIHSSHTSFGNKGASRLKSPSSTFINPNMPLKSYALSQPTINPAPPSQFTKLPVVNVQASSVPQKKSKTVEAERRFPVFCWGVGGKYFVGFPLKQTRYGNNSPNSPITQYRPSLILIDQLDILNDKEIDDCNDKITLFSQVKNVDNCTNVLLESIDKSISSLSTTSDCDFKLFLTLLGLLFKKTGDLKSLVDVLLSENNASDPHSNSTNPFDDLKVEKKSEKAIAKIEDLILRGEREMAVHLSVTNQLWSHALLIASHVDRETYCAVVSEFAKHSLSKNSSLRRLYLLFSGQNDLAALEAKEAYTDHGSGSHLWKNDLAMILNNRVEGDGEVIIALADVLSERENFFAAHTCYILADDISLLDGEKINLIGADPKNANFFSNWKNFEFTWALECAYRASSPEFRIAHIQSLKLFHAYRWSEFGNLEISKLLLDDITENHCSPEVCAKRDQLKKSLQLEYFESKNNKNGGWENILQAFDRGLTRVITGENENRNVPINEKIEEFNVAPDPSLSPSDAESMKSVVGVDKTTFPMMSNNDEPSKPRIPQSVDFSQHVQHPSHHLFENQLQSSAVSHESQTFDIRTSHSNLQNNNDSFVSPQLSSHNSQFHQTAQLPNQNYPSGLDLNINEKVEMNSISSRNSVSQITSQHALKNDQIQNKFIPQPHQNFTTSPTNINTQENFNQTTLNPSLGGIQGNNSNQSTIDPFSSSNQQASFNQINLIPQQPFMQQENVGQTIPNPSASFIPQKSFDHQNTLTPPMAPSQNEYNNHSNYNQSNLNPSTQFDQQSQQKSLDLTKITSQPSDVQDGLDKLKINTETEFSQQDKHTDPNNTNESKKKSVFGMFTGWFGGKKSNSPSPIDDADGPKVACLGEESTFHWDENLKRWVDSKNPAPPQETAPIAPPTISTPSGPNQNFRRAPGRNARSKYLDPFASSISENKSEQINVSNLIPQIPAISNKSNETKQNL